MTRLVVLLCLILVTPSALAGGVFEVSGLDASMEYLGAVFGQMGTLPVGVEGSPLFWGDKCRDHIKYVRNFVFDDINTLAACPHMPYHDRARPLTHSLTCEPTVLPKQRQSTGFERTRLRRH